MALLLVALLALPPQSPRGDGASGGEAPSWVAEAEALLEGGEPERAAELLRARLEGAPAAPGAAWLLLGRALKALRDHEAAAEAFSRALTEEPLAGLLLAESRLEMKDAAGAGEALRRSPGPPDAEASAWRDELLALSLVLEGREEEARPHLERARAGGRPQASHFLGLHHFHRGEFEAAAGLLEEAARIDPADYYSRLYRGWALLELQRLDAARRALEDARGVAATPEVEEMLGRVALREERFEEAEARFRAALRAGSSAASVEFGLATALRRLGRKEEAAQALQRVRALHRREEKDLARAYELNQLHLASPRDAARAEELARHQLGRGDVPEAERLAWRALALEPGRAGARLVLARALSRSGRYREAALHYGKVLRLDEANQEARRELEELRRLHGRRREPRGG